MARKLKSVEWRGRRWEIISHAYDNVYWGIALKKDGTRNKSVSTRNIVLSECENPIYVEVPDVTDHSNEDPKLFDFCSTRGYGLVVSKDPSGGVEFVVYSPLRGQGVVLAPEDVNRLMNALSSY